MPIEKKSVVVYKALPEPMLDSLRERFELTCFDAVDASNRDAFLRALETAHGLLGASLRLTAEMVDRAPRLEIVSSVSVGVDAFDVAHLSRRGIMLAHTPQVLTETTADAVFALILATARRVVELAGLVKAGLWTGSIGEPLYGVDVHGKTLGLLGMGRIGQAVARRAHLGFGMRVLYHSRTPSAEAEAAFAARRVPMDELLAASDFVCVLLPLTPATERLLGAREFALMQPGAIFINAARGRIVDEAALVAALRQGRPMAAGLDVFEHEPLGADSPLLSLPRVVALPHIGSATRETRWAMAQAAVDNLVAGLSGQQPRWLANAPAPRAGVAP